MSLRALQPVSDRLSNLRVAIQSLNLFHWIATPSLHCLTNELKTGFAMTQVCN